MPGFHPTEYPFLLVTGKEETWMVNIHTKKAQTLFTAAGKPFFVQPGVVFHHTAPEVKCLYVHQAATPRGQLQYSLSEMTLFKDFEKVLRGLQFLPEVSVKKTYELYAKLKALKEAGVDLNSAGETLEEPI